MVSEKLRNLGNIQKILWVGRKKGRRLFRPLGFLRGSEEVQKYGTERSRMRTGEACPMVEDWSGKFFELPQGLGTPINFELPD